MSSHEILDDRRSLSASQIPDVDTAVIPLSGLGTRMYPFSAEIPKFMATVIDGNRAVPNIDYTLQDCLGAGIKNFVFVVSRDGDRVLKKYLGPMDAEVEEGLRGLGKYDVL